MPDDNLFDDKPDDDKEGEGDNKDKSPEDTAAKIAAQEQQLAALQKAQADGAANTQQLAAAIQALTQQIEQAKGTVDDDEPPPPDPKSEAAARQAKFNKFYEDPEGFIAKEAELRAKATLGPYLRMQAEQRRDEILESQQARIDALHGPGTWDKYFSKDLADTLRDVPLEMQASRPHMARAVEAIYGRLQLDDKLRDELSKGREAVAKAKAAPPALMDGGRAAPKAGALNDDEQAFLASLERSGITVSAKDYLAAKERGNTEDRWARQVAQGRK